ncbi:DUF448 domain-containing protein [Qipengyuania sp. MTN3-11]|uniref:DUF448 domain-containing protein n=1 Tax=Qipengyuania sp. MTN3-11 TaxID=3056557 RepID=UPI0036F39E68
MRTPLNERLSSDIAEAAEARTKSEPARSCPERRCVLSGETGHRDALIRLAVSPAGLVLPDPQAKAPGRGAWICVSRCELQAALDKGKLRAALARAFKTGSLEIADDLPQRVEDALIRNFLDRLGLEMRTGSLILGTQRIADAARAGDVALLLHASDASEDGRKKLDQAWRVGSDREGSGERGVVLPLDRTALSVALGRENVVHLGVAAARTLGRSKGQDAAERVRRALNRLLLYVDSAETDGRAPAPARDDNEILKD